MNLSRNKPVQNGVSSEEAVGHENKKDFCAGKALREEVVLERVYGELAGAYKVYLDSCNSEFELINCCSSLLTSVIKRSVRDLLIY